MAEGASGEDAPADGGLLTLQEAADRLKVHYMTAYRWVRKGELPAFKAGGRLRVREADLDAFMTARRVDVALPSEGAQRTDWPLHVDRLHQLLAAGEGVEAGALVRKVIADGAPAADVYVHLIAPALHRIGEDWAAGRLTVAGEHRATEIASAVMARLGGHFRRRGPARGTAVTLTPPGEQHALGAAMTADVLRASGYDVHHLGPNVPVEDLRLFLQVVPTDLVCVSVSTSDLDPGLYREIVAAAHESDKATTVAFGGQGVDREDAQQAGGEVVGGLVELGDRLEALAAD